MVKFLFAHSKIVEQRIIIVANNLHVNTMFKSNMHKLVNSKRNSMQSHNRVDKNMANYDSDYDDDET